MRQQPCWRCSQPSTSSRTLTVERWRCAHACTVIRTRQDSRAVQASLQRVEDHYSLSNTLGGILGGKMPVSFVHFAAVGPIFRLVAMAVQAATWRATALRCARLRAVPPRRDARVRTESRLRTFRNTLPTHAADGGGTVRVVPGQRGHWWGPDGDAAVPHAGACVLAVGLSLEYFSMLAARMLSGVGEASFLCLAPVRARARSARALVVRGQRAFAAVH